jgi:hypothetical protein
MKKRLKNSEKCRKMVKKEMLGSRLPVGKAGAVSYVGLAGLACRSAKRMRIGPGCVIVLVID